MKVKESFFCAIVDVIDRVPTRPFSADEGQETLNGPKDFSVYSFQH